jgi:hypothetical protein
MKSISTGRLLLTLVGAFTAISPWVFDYGETHMFNDRWPPHAKFHNAQTLLLGTSLGLLTLYFCRQGRRDPARSLHAACLAGSLYWVTQAGSILLPNTSLTDPEFAASVPHPLGFSGPQPIVDVVVLTTVLVAYGLERLRLSRRGEWPTPHGTRQNTSAWVRES